MSRLTQTKQFEMDGIKLDFEMIVKPHVSSGSLTLRQKEILFQMYLSLKVPATFLMSDWIKGGS